MCTMPYHTVQCSDAGIYDRVVIQDLIKTVAQSHQLDSGTQKEFKGKQYNLIYVINLYVFYTDIAINGAVYGAVCPIKMGKLQ